MVPLRGMLWLLAVLTAAGSACAQRGEVLYDTPGTYTFTVPTGVSSISVVCVGGGGGSGTLILNSWPHNGTAGGGGGGALAYVNNMAVKAGSTFNLAVGAGGKGSAQAGGASWFNTSAWLLAQGGAAGKTGGGKGGAFSGQAPGRKGMKGARGGDQSWVEVDATAGTGYDIAGGGGGAAGWVNAASLGGFGADGSNPPGPIDVCNGCGGGGAAAIADNRAVIAGGGGGVNIYGQGRDGLPGNATVPGGTGGSGGINGGLGTGGRLGGGAGGAIGLNLVDYKGGDGACRIVYPGSTRTFPITDVNATVAVASPSPPPPVVVAPSPPPPTVVAPSPPPPVVVAPSPPPPVVVAPSPPPPVVVAPSPPPPVVVTPSPPPPPVPTFVTSLDHRILVLTIPSFTNTQFLQNIMSGYSIPYDVILFNPAAPVEANTFLYKPNGSPKYSAILMYPMLESLGALNNVSSLQLETYQLTTGARIVRFGANMAAWGVPYVNCTAGSGQAMSFTAGTPMGISGIKRNAAMTGDLLYRCPAAAPLPATANCIQWSRAFNTQPCNLTSILELAPAPAVNLSITTVVGLIAKHEDGRETMAISMDCAVWQPSCMILGHVVVSWLAHDIIPGQRRALLNTQIDDLFLGTVLYNSTETEYRMTPVDYQKHMTWLSDLKAIMAPGSTYRPEFAYNGNGVLSYAQDPAIIGQNDTDPQTIRLKYNCQADEAYITQGCSCFGTTWEACNATPDSFCRNCSYTWRRPETDWINANGIPAGYNSSQWLPTTTWTAVDPLAQTAVQDISTGKQTYYWMSHTFTHQNLNNVTAYDAEQQWKLNIDMAARLGLDANNGLSTKGVVTPQITGLFNINNYKKMVAAGFTAAVGDNTWDILKNLASPYQMLTTYASQYGYDGFKIMPRGATEVYFNCNDTYTEELLYNKLYTTYYGGPSTTDQIMQREGLRMVRNNILALKMDPAMFHQANMGTAGGTTKSLLQRWVESVVNQLSAWTVWPVETLKMDDLIQEFLKKQARDACGLTYTLNFAPGSRSVSSISVTSSSGSCSAPLLVPDTATVSGSASAVAAAAGSMTRLADVAAGGGTQWTTSKLTW